LKEKIKRYEEGEIVKQTPMRNAKKNELEKYEVCLLIILHVQLNIIGRNITYYFESKFCDCLVPQLENITKKHYE